MIYTNSDYLVDQLTQNQTQFVFTIPGKLIDPLFESVVNSSQIQPIIANHELGAGFMADGYARAAQNRGVCLCIGAPGASNLLTAAVTARLDRSSVLFIVGNIPVAQEGFGAFQDGGMQGTRDDELFQCAVDYGGKVTQPERFDEYLNQALTATAYELRCPAFLSIPLDVQQAIYSPKKPMTESNLALPIQPKPSGINWTNLCQFLNHNQNILLLVGQLASTQEAQWLLALAEKFCLPVATVASAKGIMPEHHPLCLGTFGFSGNHRATHALARDDIDAIVLIGVNLSEPDCLGWTPQNYLEDRLFLINQNPLKRFPLSCERQLLVSNYSAFLQDFFELDHQQLAGLWDSKPLRQQWLQSLQAVAWNSNLSSEGFDFAIPLEPLLNTLNQQLPDDTLLCVDAGVARRVAGYAWRCKIPGSFFSAHSTAPMGWAIAAGVGVQLAHPEKTVLVVTGDGSMRMHGLEIATASRYQLPIIYVVCNNQAYGSVHVRYAPQSAASQQTKLPPINWVQLAQSLGVAGTKVSTLSALKLAIEQALSRRQPFVIEAITPIIQPLYP